MGPPSAGRLPTEGNAMNASKRAVIFATSLACFAGAAVYVDYKWFFVAAGTACVLRALVFTRRF